VIHNVKYPNLALKPILGDNANDDVIILPFLEGIMCKDLYDLNDGDNKIGISPINSLS
jgi:hypothetical protein